MPQCDPSNRPLLPYEHGLIEALGITKREYLDFVCAKQEYIDSKEGSVLDIRNEAASTISIILTVVGIIFQVAAALLAPTPQQPKQGQGVKSREERSVPRFGFNGIQDVSKYGDPVPIVYTNRNQNNNGGVRVSTLLLWSAVLSYGGSQFMQLMMALGASTVKTIIPERTAIGQLPFNEVIRSNAWLYFNGNGATTYQDFQPVGALAEVNDFRDDPTWYDNSGNATTAVLAHVKEARRGFSQAYAPTTGSTCGVTGVIPVRGKIIELDKAGEVNLTDFVPISIDGLDDAWRDNGPRPIVRKGTRIVVTIEKTTSDAVKEADGTKAIQAALRNAAAVFDEGSLYQFGAAVFRAERIEYTGKAEIEFSSLRAYLVCEKQGSMPTINPSAVWDGKGGSQASGKKQLVSDKDKRIISLRERLVDLRDQLKREKFIVGDSLKARELTQEIADVETEISALTSEVAALKKEIKQTVSNYSKVMERMGTKCLARIDQASYSSVTKCDVLELSLKAQIYRQVNGRQKQYGSDKEDYGYEASENGSNPRVVMFTCEYAIDNEGFSRIPYIFCMRGAVQQDFFTYMRFIKAAPGASSWRIRLSPVIEPLAEARSVNTTYLGYAYINSNGSKQRISNVTCSIEFNGFIEEQFTAWPPINNGAEDTMEWELFNYDVRSQTRYSFEQGPELSIVAVNEQLKDRWSQYGDALYRGLSTVAVHAFAGRGFQDLRDVTVWVDEGKLVRSLSDRFQDYSTPEQIDAFVASAKTSSSSYAPEIFIDTVLDRDNGIGAYAKIESVQMQELAKAQAFCKRNQLFMDGVIADPEAWRQFWVKAATYSLLELATIGGQTTLVPALPATSDGRILSAAPLNISTLFNQGNILEGSYKEEFIDYGSSTQDVLVTVIYRDSEDKGYFPRNDSVTLRLRGSVEELCIHETIDVSQFVTTRRQAALIGRYTCLIRNLSRKAYEFKTLPTEGFVAPNSYIFVDIGQEVWDDLHTGSIGAGGVLNLPLGGSLPEAEGGSLYDYFLYNGRQNTFVKRDVLTQNGAAPSLAQYAGHLFAVGRRVTAKGKRVARVVDVEMDEEGLVSIKAVEHPTDENDVSLLAKRIVDPSLFIEI